MSLSESKIEEMRDRLEEAIAAGDKAMGIQLAQEALAAQSSALDFFKAVIEPVLEDVGDRFARLEIFLPELMKAGMVIKAMQKEVLEPAIRAEGSASTTAGKIVIGTCQGDIHDIGKNMVALMLQVNGFDVADLGTDIAPRTVIEAAQREQADIIALSSLLTPSMPYIRDVVQLLEGYGLRDQFQVVAGGAAVTRDWAKSIGADGFGEDAIEAVEVCRSLMTARKEKDS
jgi:methylmalonyl-CoA mutase cobalamin-binding domain/chain